MVSGSELDVLDNYFGEWNFLKSGRNNKTVKENGNIIASSIFDKIDFVILL